MTFVGWLTTGFGILLTATAALYAFLCLFLLFECLLAFLSHRQSVQQFARSTPSFAILMPAHNEASVIQKTLTQLLPEVETPGQIMVVADNCQDETATIA
ncbi:MAG: glycosyl transferase, partial [Cyanobacteria bacterium J06626_18]